MNEIDGKLAKLDLNLLTALNALLHHQSVSKAAGAVGRTQSAMSHSLSRLRQHFEDPLLVRDGWAMNLTPLGQEMRPHVAQVAAAVQSLFDGNRPFDPSQSTRTIRIATRDICVPLLTPLIARISAAGSGLSVEIVESTSIRSDVLNNIADVGLGFGGAKDSGTLTQRVVKSLTWCVFAPTGHPYIQSPTQDVWAASSHVLVGSPKLQSGPIEAKAKTLGLERHVFCYAPNFTSALGLAADCNALFTTLKEPFCQKGMPEGLEPCAMPFDAAHAMPPAPAVLTLRKSWGNPFETWLAHQCAEVAFA